MIPLSKLTVCLYYNDQHFNIHLVFKRVEIINYGLLQIPIKILREGYMIDIIPLSLIIANVVYEKFQPSCVANLMET